MDYIDGIILIGGTVYNKYMEDIKKYQENEYHVIRLDPSGDGKYKQAVINILKKAK